MKREMWSAKLGLARKSRLGPRFVILVVLCLLPAEALSQSLTWRQLPTVTQPSGRYLPGMAYDSARDRVVLFGGWGGWWTNLHDDTWAWDGTSWSQAFPAHHPSARGCPSMAYDALRREVVLFGGHDPSGTGLGDTWVWDGTDWIQKFPMTVPPTRFYGFMAYDSARETVVMFGGGGGQQNLGDTWQWDGTNWTQLFPAHSPGPRATICSSSMAYDSRREVIVLFGGMSEYPYGRDDTWEWNGTDWAERLPEHRPPPRCAHGVVALPYGLGAMTLGGYHDYGLRGDTWVWNGTDWHQETPNVAPATRHAYAMVYDSMRERVILFGGWDWGTWFNDTWECSIDCSLSLSPPVLATYYPCGGQYSMALSARNLPDLGAWEACTGFDNGLANLVDVVMDSSFIGSTGREPYQLGSVPCQPSCQVVGQRDGVFTIGNQQGPSGDGVLAHLLFSRQEDAVGEDEVCIEDWEVVDTELPPQRVNVSEAHGTDIVHRCFCYGDFNDDFEITVTDVMSVAGRWGCCEGEACYADTFDVNLVEPGNYCMSAPDRCIDIVDVQEVAARWGLGCPGVVHAPHFAEFLDQKLRVLPDTLTVIADGRETATLDVVVDDAHDLGALEMTVRFDPSVIQVQNVVVGDFLASTGRSVYALGPQIDNEGGEVKFGAWTTGETPGPEGSGVIAHVVLAGTSQEGETGIEVKEATLAYTHGWPQMVSEVESGIVRTVLSTSVSEPGAAVPRSYALFQNVPNPFNPRTEIRYSVPVGGPVKVAIYDVAGREVAVVANGPHEAGNFTAVWDGVESKGASVVSGIYFVRMEAGDFTATRKTVLLR